MSPREKAMAARFWLAMRPELHRLYRMARWRFRLDRRGIVSWEDERL